MAAKYASKEDPQDGDIVGIMGYLHYQTGPKRGERRGMEVKARGRVLGRPYRDSPRGMWLVRVHWDSAVEGFIFTGKDHKAYVSDLHLLRAAP